MKKELFSIPNILCYIRFLFVGWFLYMYMKEAYFESALIIAAGGITDCLDGQIARRCNMITQLGKILDPMADKAMQLAIAIALTTRYPLMGILLVLFLVKEIFQAVCCLIGLKKHKKLDGAMWFGKVSTAVFYVVTVLLIAFVNMPIWLVNTCICITMFCLAYAFVMYAITFYRMLKDE